MSCSQKRDAETALPERSAALQKGNLIGSNYYSTVTVAKLDVTEAQDALLTMQ
jgi:hypothetical protein